MLVNDELERVCLAAMLCSGKHRDTVLLMLTAEHFARGANKNIFEASASLTALSMDTSVESIAAYLSAHGKLNGGLEALKDLRMSFPSGTDVRSVCAHVRSLAILREAQEIGRSLIDGAEGAKDAAAAFVDEKSKRLADLTKSATITTVPTIAEIGQAAVVAIVNAVKGQRRIGGLATGLATIDAMTDGWPIGELSVLAGRPGMGKSTLAMQSAADIAGRGKFVYVGSLEMPGGSLFDRLLAHFSKVDNRKIKSRSGFTQEDFNRVTANVNRVMGLPIRIDDFSEKPKSPFFIEAGVRETADAAKKAGAELGAIFIDYLQLTDTRGIVAAKANREQEVGAASRFYLGLAKRYGVPVIALSQLNRPPKTVSVPPPPQLTDLRESGSIEQDASLVLFVHREEFYTRSNTKPDMRGKCDLICAKNRNGEMGDAELAFDGPTLTFSDLQQEPGLM